ncbi:hypothetical protein OPV22_020088 [Ensete ventricosum]|uniref:Uncharacterized protein n=1 Tax=Ensete ventricosum TaxID=4639 RepID=A0AAV8P9H5_ENSVE|nr:hypothetical protein OPV22_020088 [Ensete ventricosum]
MAVFHRLRGSGRCGGEKGAFRPRGVADRPVPCRPGLAPAPAADPSSVSTTWPLVTSSARSSPHPTPFISRQLAENVKSRKTEIYVNGLLGTVFYKQ